MFFLVLRLFLLAKFSTRYNARLRVFGQAKKNGSPSSISSRKISPTIHCSPSCFWTRKKTKGERSVQVWLLSIVPSCSLDGQRQDVSRGGRSGGGSGSGGDGDLTRRRGSRRRRRRRRSSESLTWGRRGTRFHAPQLQYVACSCFPGSLSHQRCRRLQQ